MDRDEIIWALWLLFLHVFFVVVFAYAVSRLACRCVRGVCSMAHRRISNDGDPIMQDIAVQVELAPTITGMTVEGLREVCDYYGLRRNGLCVDEAGVVAGEEGAAVARARPDEAVGEDVAEAVDDGGLAFPGARVEIVDLVVQLGRLRVALREENVHHLSHHELRSYICPYIY